MIYGNSIFLQLFGRKSKLAAYYLNLALTIPCILMVIQFISMVGEDKVELGLAIYGNSISILSNGKKFNVVGRFPNPEHTIHLV
jgi:hypothetical protein